MTLKIIFVDKNAFGKAFCQSETIAELQQHSEHVRANEHMERRLWKGG